MNLGFPLKQSQDVAQIVPHTGKNLVAVGSLQRPVFRQLLAGAGDRESPIVEKVLDLQNHLDVLPAIDPMPGLAFLGRQHWKLGLPVTQDKRLHAGKLTHFTDLEEQFVWDLRGSYCARQSFLAPPRRSRWRIII